jgi:tRNA (guanine-N7-)-methyltransferase
MTQREGHFYGRRKGKPMTSTRQELLADNDYILQVEHVQPFLQKYNRHVLEIGFGNGEHVVEMAKRHTNTAYIGCEAFINGVSTCIADAQQVGVDNLRIWADDALVLLSKMTDEVFDEIYLLFPDPWPKTRHHKRRFIQKDTVEMLARLLKPQGCLWLVTDDHNLAEWMLLHAVQSAQLHWKNALDAEWRQTPSDWIPTRYQQKAAAQGRCPHFIQMIKI